MVQRPDLRPAANQQTSGTTRPDLRPAAMEKSFAEKTAGMTHEQIVDEYRKAKINSPYYNFLVKKIEAPQAGETPEQAALRAGGQKPTGTPSQSLSAFGGAAEQLSFGGADELGAGIDWLRGEDYDQSLAKHRRFRDELEETNPGSYLAGQIGGGVVQAAATLGASAPETFLGRLGMNVLGGASQGATYGALSTDGDIGDRLGGAAEGAGWGTAFGLAPSILEGGYKTLRGGVQAARNVSRQYFNPQGVATDRLARGLAQDYIDYGRLARREQAAGADVPLPDFITVPEANSLLAQGHRVQMSDFGGENMRRELKDASNISASASKRMRDAANARQEGQAGRVTSEISDLYGGEINPKHITDSLEEEGARWNKRNYDAAMNHPNAGHFWGPAFENLLSSTEGKAALKEATDVLRTDAMKGKVPFYEPVFEPDVTGRMQFQGFRAPNGELFGGNQGLNLNFWNEFKIAVDEQIRGLRSNGFMRKASQLTELKNDMLKSIDVQLDSDVYRKARGDAKEIFDLVGKNGKGGALRAGAEYLTKMDAIDTAEARAALEAMNPMERELFARGFSAELVNRISQMGDTEDVSKMFKSSQSRMKVVDALGEENAARIEALVHAEQAQGMLRKVINGGSDTARNLLSAEGLMNAAGQAASNAAPAAGGAAAGYYTTGDISGLLLGFAGGAGFKYVNRAAARRVADMMAEIALSEDPAVIKALLAKAAADPEYMAFSRAVSNAASSTTGAAGRTAGGAAGNQRIEPRMPFADGGPVRLAGGDLVAKAIGAVTRAGRSTVKHPVRKAFPGIYKDPRALLEDVRIEPEDPALKQLFGVTRDDLYEISKRKGNVKDILGIEGKVSRGSEATDNIKTPRNAQRLLDALDVARTNEGLWKGMHGWYTMDPAYQQLVRDYGPEEGARMFQRLNTLTGMSSPGSEVITELQRGTAANMMDRLGRFDEFLEKGGIGKDKRGQGFPQELQAVDGHPYHSTSQAPAMDNYLRTGRVEMGSAKVPTYIGASTPPELGNFTDLPVADAHFTRAVGLPDTRTAEKVFDHSMSMGEYKAVAPWYRDRVAAQAGIESVPAQAIHWGLFGPQTGVTTPVGAPKLELLAKGIMETARRLGVSPDVARDLVLSGRAHAYREGGLVSAIGTAVH